MVAAPVWGQDVAPFAPPALSPIEAPQQVQPPPPITTTLTTPSTPYSSWNEGTPAAATTPAATGQVASPAAAIATPEAMEACEVVAKIDGQLVQACEIMWQVNQVIEDNRDKIPPGEIDMVRQMLMQRQILTLVDTKLLYADFLRSGVPPENMEMIFKQLDKPFEEVQIPQLMKRFEAESPADLEAKLHALDSSMRDMRNAFREQALASEWLRNKVEYNEEVTHDDMLEYYQAHIKDYEFPTQVRWEELMVRRQRFGSRNEAIAEICRMGNLAFNNAVSQKLHGPIFAEVAKASSHGYSAQEGGIQDWTTQGALKAKEIDEALFSLAVGQVSDLIFSDVGIHIVRVIERKDAGRTPFTEVQTEITNAIKMERLTAARSEYLAKLRGTARVWTIYTGDTSVEQLASPSSPPTRR